jgi:hypothetical protein
MLFKPQSTAQLVLQPRFRFCPHLHVSVSDVRMIFYFLLNQNVVVAQPKFINTSARDITAKPKAIKLLTNLTICE